jgi:DNA-binding GntR family transcriptional regulator
MAEPASVSTVEQVVAAIVTAVRDGHLVPGQRLTEAEFTRRQGVSRSSVREAFQRLRADGLLAFEPNRGVTVRRLSRKEVDALFQVRGALEALAVELAIPALHAAPGPLSDLCADMDRAVAGNDMNRFTALNAQFHALMLRAAGNALLAEQLGRLANTVYGLQFRILVDREAVFRSHAQHRRIAAAVVAGDTMAAAAAMREHVADSCRLVQSLSDAHFSGEGEPVGSKA